MGCLLEILNSAMLLLRLLWWDQIIYYMLRYPYYYGWQGSSSEDMKMEISFIGEQTTECLGFDEINLKYFNVMHGGIHLWR